jgi:23S rRNA (uracil-5-)-methyltransferase RumA
MKTVPEPRPRLVIEKIVYPGRRLARADGQVYFTDEGLPGETVEIEILRTQASFIEARTTAVLVPSPFRVAPRCGHYRICGAYQTMPYPEQLAAKRAQFLEMVKGAALSIPHEPEIIPSPSVWGYRNRVRFSLVRRDQKASLAYHEPGSRESHVEIGGCFLATESAGALADAVRDAVNERDMENLGGIEIRESLEEKAALLNIFWKKRRNVGEIDAILSAVRTRFSLAGIVSWTPERGGRTAETLEWGRGSLREKVGRTILEFGSGSFFQVNGAILPRVIEDFVLAGGLSGTETVADIYGGVGTFGLALAEKAKRVHVVESFPANIRFLQANIVSNNFHNVSICEGTAEEWMPLLAGRGLDLAIVDPPRKGLAPEVVRALRENPIAKILYLSCNPTTLVRDLGRLGGRYRVENLRLYDFFPQTPHIETLAVLIPR